MLGDVTESAGMLLSMWCDFSPYNFANSSSLTFYMTKLCKNPSIFLFFQYHFYFCCIFMFLNTICLLFTSVSLYHVFYSSFLLNM